MVEGFAQITWQQWYIQQQGGLVANVCYILMIAAHVVPEPAWYSGNLLGTLSAGLRFTGADTELEIL